MTAETRGDDAPRRSLALGDRLAGMGETFTSLKEPEYALYFTGSFAFFMAMQMQLLLRNFLAFDLTGKAVSLAIIAVGGGVVLLVMAPVGGVFADRLDKRKLLVTTEALVALLSLAVTVLIFTDLITFWQLAAVSPILAGLFSFIMPTRQALVPNLVPKHKLGNAISLQMGGTTLTQVVAPALAGLLIAPLGVGAVFGITTVMFALAAASDTRLPRHGLVGSGEPKRFREDLAGGFGYIAAHRTIALLLVASLAMPLFAFPVQQMLPVFAEDVFGRGAGVLGVLSAMLGLGGLTGALISANLDRQPRKGLLLFIGGMGMGAFMLAYSVSPTFWIALPLLAGMGTGQMLFNATNSTSIQAMLTSEVRGRVMSVMMMSFGMMPLGVIPVAIASDTIGPRAALAMSASLLLVCLATFFAVSGRLRGLRIERATEARLSRVQAAELVAAGKLTKEQAAALTGEGEAAG